MNNTLRIESNPSYCNIQDILRIYSVAESIKSRLVNFEELTHATAIRILRSIKWEADVQSFFCKPIVHIPVLLLAALLSIKCTDVAFDTLNTPLFILGLAGITVVGPLLTFVVVNTSLFLTASRAYKEKSEEAARYLETLEKSAIPLKVLV